MFNFGFKKRENSPASPASPLLTAFLVFTALMVIIVMSWRTANRDIKIQQKNMVSQNALSVESTLKYRFSVYENSLRAANGLFVASDTVNRSEWDSFVSSLMLPERYPGIRALGYITLVSSDSKAIFEETVRAEGLNNFSIYPAKEKAQYAPLLYLVDFTEPEDTAGNNTALGFEMYSDVDRMQAMKRSASTGEAMLSKELKLIQLKDGKQSEGILMYFPHYNKNMPITTPEERIAAIDGYFYAPFSSDVVFSTIFNSTLPSFAFALYQGEPSKDTQFFISNDYNDVAFKQVKRTNLTIYGQNWSIVYKAKYDIVAASVRSRPSNVLLAGTIFSLSLAVIVYLLIQRRTRSLEYDEQRKLEVAKDDLLSLASHQLRTPATAVKQYISMVKDGFAGEVEPEQSRLLQMAYDSNERQLRIVDDLLYVARIDAGKATLRMEKLNIASLMQSVIDDQLTVIKNNKQTVKLSKPRSLTITNGDPQYLRMIFENLLSNSSKYSHKNTKINIVIKELNGKIFINFIDNGVGIASKDFPRVFYKFSRIQNELTRQTAGSGIGLYLAKQLAVLHGGDITFISQPKKGTTFTVQLPVHK